MTKTEQPNQKVDPSVQCLRYNKFSTADGSWMYVYCHLRRGHVCKCEAVLDYRTDNVVTW